MPDRKPPCSAIPLAFIFLCFGLPAAVANVSFCEPELVKVTDVPPGQIRRAESFVDFAIDGLEVWNGADWTHVVPRAVDRVTAAHRRAVLHYVRGEDRRGDDAITKLARVIARADGPRADEHILRRDVRETAARPEIERSLGAAPRDQKPQVSETFANLAAAFPDDLITGPQQVELVRLLTQFRGSNSRDATVVIGVGVTSVIASLRTYRRFGRLDGVETLMDPAAAAHVYLSERNARVDGGHFNDRALAQLTTNGPFARIAALDVLAHESLERAGLTDAPGAIARKLRRSLVPGGRLLILNDFGREPLFTRAQAEAAGFRIMRWNLDRTLPTDARDLIPYDDDPANGGHLRAFVLENSGGDT